MQSHSCLRALRRTLEVSGLRAPLYAGDRVDGKPLDGWHQASIAGTLRSGCAGVPAAFPGTGQCSCDERFYRLVRACCAHAEELREPFEGGIECDETTIGGARHGKRGWGAAGKVIVLGILQRNGQVKVFAVPAREGKKVTRLVRAHTKPGSLYYTDDWQAYGSLRVQGDHVVVRKERGRPKGRDHINGIEGFWSYAKNWLYPFRGVPRKHLHLFLGEICFRFNHRDEDLFPLLYSKLRTTGMSEINPVLVRFG